MAKENESIETYILQVDFQPHTGPYNTCFIVHTQAFRVQSILE
jgi:hypothetical protein